MNRWDVILLRYPFTHQQVTKVRPAVVISPDVYHQKGADVLVVLITSNITRNSPHDIIVNSGHPEFQKTGLLKDSAIRVSKIMTLEKTAIHSPIGKLGPQLITLVERELRAFLELPPLQQQLMQQIPATPKS